MSAMEFAKAAREAIERSKGVGDPDRRKELFEEAVAFALASIALSLTNSTIITVNTPPPLPPLIGRSVRDVY